LKEDDDCNKDDIADINVDLDTTLTPKTTSLAPKTTTNTKLKKVNSSSTKLKKTIKKRMRKV